ncbi:MAG: NAD(P)-dependent oxidoreductase [Hyphomicrobiaceae bacterium]
MKKPFAFIGLGAMGLPIARRLAEATGRLAVADLSRSRVDRLLSQVGAAATADPEAVRQAQTVFLCLPSAEATRAVVTELLRGAEIDRVFIDLGALAPAFVGEMARLCAERSAVFCDAPVFGTPLMAENGQLYFLFSGDEHVGREFSKIAALAGYRFRYAGAAGCASTVKLLQNALGTANLCAAAEAFQVCEAAAIDTGVFIDVVRECGGIGLSTVFDRFADDMAARRDSGQGRLRIAAKDMKSAVELAHSSSVSVPVMEQTASQFQRAVDMGLEEQQFTAVVQVGGTARAKGDK